MRFFRRKSATDEPSISAPAPQDPIDYESVELLDAEDLAEGGIGEAYEQILPAIAKWVPNPWSVHEDYDSERGRYAVRAGGREYVIYDENTDELRSWYQAAGALFLIINAQMQEAPVWFYAIGGGHDLFGVVLTPEEADQAQRALPRPDDRPFLPTEEAPWVA